MAGTIIASDEFGITGDEPIEEQVKILRDRVFMLLEQLKYLLANLGAENFNDAELKAITEPIYAQIADTEGKVAELAVTADGLALSISDINQGLYSLTISVNGLSSTVSSLNGRFSTVEQSVDGLAITTVGGTSYITGDHIRSGTIEGVTLLSKGAVSGADVAIQEGQIVVLRDRLPIAYFRYDSFGRRVYLNSDMGLPLKIESDAGMSIDAASGTTMYIGTSNRGQVIMIGDSVYRDNTVSLWGNVLINGQSLEAYITEIAGA